MNRQARIKGDQEWTDYGNSGLIEAAELHAEVVNLDRASIEVRDLDSPDEIMTFHMRKVCKYVCDNPRQGSQ